MLSRPLVSYVLTAALRDRLVITLVLLVCAGAGLGAFLGAAAVTEQESFSTVFGAGGLRFMGVAGLVLFVCFYMRRAFDSKEVEFMLSRPVSRLSYLFSHAVAFFVIALVIAVLVTVVLLATGRPQIDGLLLWGASLATEYIMMAAVALFFSVVLASAAGAALAALAFYALARLVGMLVGIALVPAENIFFAVLNNVMELISVVIPRFDLLGQTSWLVYGVEGGGGIMLRDHAGAYATWLAGMLGDTGFVFLQAVIFVVMVLFASAYDFLRREF